MGIEPTSKAWEAFILPLNYTRKSMDSTMLLALRATIPEGNGNQGHKNKSGDFKNGV